MNQKSNTSAEPKHSGQTFASISKLKEIASIEQARSDWRGATLSIIGWVSLASIAGVFVQFAISPQDLFSLLNIDVNAVLPTARELIAGILILLIVVVSLFGLVPWVLLTNTLTLYFATESANRLLLVACIEAQSLLEELGLHENTRIPLEDKKRLAEYLGWAILTETEYLNAKPKRAFHFLEGDAVCYLAYQPPIPAKNASVISHLWARVKSTANALLAAIQTVRRKLWLRRP